MPSIYTASPPQMKLGTGVYQEQEQDEQQLLAVYPTYMGSSSTTLRGRVYMLASSYTALLDGYI